MSDQAPVFAFLAPRKKDVPETISLKENKQYDIDLGDSRILHVTIENTTKTTPQQVLTEEQKRVRTLVGFSVMWLLLAICMLCFLLASL